MIGDVVRSICEIMQVYYSPTTDAQVSLLPVDDSTGRNKAKEDIVRNKSYSQRKADSRQSIQNLNRYSRRKE